MSTRPYQLSRIVLDDMTILGYSVGGEESVIIIPELAVAFDIGKCPRQALRINHVLLTHGHMDHSAGVPYYFSQRDFQGIADGVVLAPARLVGPLRDLMAAMAEVEGHPSPYRFVPMKDGQDFDIRRGLFARAFATRHVGATLGYAVIEVRRKLKAEFADRTGPQLVELKKQGIEITNRLELPLVACLGDTARGRYCDLPHVREAKVLLVECTFFDPDHVRRARAGKHLHVTDLPAFLEGVASEHIVLTHVTRRTSIGDARTFLRKVLPDDLLGRITFLMSARHVANSRLPG